MPLLSWCRISKPHWWLRSSLEEVRLQLQACRTQRIERLEEEDRYLVVSGLVD